MTLSIAADPVPLSVDAGGTVRVTGTRVSLDSVVSCLLEGATPDEIATSFPALPLADVHAVVAYHLRHRVEVLDYLIENLRVPDDVRTAWESHAEYRAFLKRVRAARASAVGIASARA